MEQISYRCHRFPPQIIQHAIWLYCRFTLSFRDVEDLLADDFTKDPPIVPHLGNCVVEPCHPAGIARRRQSDMCFF